jgi:caa(3)-type oxidase subunit IV
MASHSETHASVPGQESIAHPKPWVYWRTFIFLLFLLFVTVILYSLDLSTWPLLGQIPGINLIVALIVAVTKAAAVVLYFMNVKNGTRLTWLWAALGFIWALLMGGIFMDYQSRGWIAHDGWQP